MNYTTNYHLPQWEESDRIQMTDFNAAMAGIEAGITSAQETADTAGGSGGIAQATAEAAQAAAEAAQQTADTALTKANKAWSPSNLPYAYYKYTGDGGNGTITVDVGFCPSLVVISGTNGQGGTAIYPYGGFSQERVSISWTATGVSWHANEAYYMYNLAGVRYIVMLWK